MKIAAFVLLAIVIIATPVFAANIGFDLDDTLAFTTPAFEMAFKSDEEPFSDGFWAVVNGADEGKSRVKSSVHKILSDHQTAGDTVYVITARKEVNVQPVKEWVSKHLGVPIGNVYFASPKVTLMKELGITVFYGDSDSDITDAMEAGATPIRIMRSPESSYTKKYNPGQFGERIIQGTEE